MSLTRAALFDQVLSYRQRRYFYFRPSVSYIGATSKSPRLAGASDIIDRLVSTPLADRIVIVQNGRRGVERLATPLHRNWLGRRPRCSNISLAIRFRHCVQRVIGSCHTLSSSPVQL